MIMTDAVTEILLRFCRFSSSVLIVYSTCICSSALQALEKRQLGFGALAAGQVTTS